jgi:hypothetical protein
VEFNTQQSFVLSHLKSEYNFVIIKGLTTCVSNNASPIITKRAKIIAKRSDVSGGGKNILNHT